jgi:hypothetical protein
VKCLIYSAYLLNAATLYEVRDCCTTSLTDTPFFAENTCEKIVHDRIKVLIDGCRGVLDQRVPNVVHGALHVRVGVESVLVLVKLHRTPYWSTHLYLKSFGYNLGFSAKYPSTLESEKMLLSPNRPNAALLDHMELWEAIDINR